MNLNPSFIHNFEGVLVNHTVDPIRLSNRLSLPFPVDTASQLSAQRSKRYDDFVFTLEEAEIRLRELASIMGLGLFEDDPPTAA
mgnify:FL=1